MGLTSARPPRKVPEDGEPGRQFVHSRTMRRWHLFELHDIEWVPAAARDALTDLMAEFAVRFDIYGPLLPKLEALVRDSGERRIVDLCSGGTGPLRTLRDRLCLSNGDPVGVLLTDLRPNVKAFRRARRVHGETVEFREEPVDAMRVPGDLEGVRTLFASFHHFSPEEATRILSDAAVHGRAIALFEFTERNFFIWGIPLLLIPPFFWCLAPFVRPLRWQSLFWIYFVPLVPLMGAWDGFVSCLRTYTVGELEEMARRACGPGYRWEVGKRRTLGVMRITYLIGHLDEHMPQPATSAYVEH